MKPKTLIIISAIFHGAIALFLLAYGIATGSILFIFVALAVILGSVLWARKKMKVIEK